MEYDDSGREIKPRDPDDCADDDGTGVVTAMVAGAVIADATSKSEESSWKAKQFGSGVGDIFVGTCILVGALIKNSPFIFRRIIYPTVVVVGPILGAAFIVGSCVSGMDWFKHDLNNSWMGKLFSKDAASQKIDMTHVGHIASKGYVEAYLTEAKTVDCYSLNRKFDASLPEWNVTFPKGTVVMAYDGNGKTTIPVRVAKHFSTVKTGYMFHDAACGFPVETKFLAPVIPPTEGSWVEPKLPTKTGAAPSKAAELKK